MSDTQTTRRRFIMAALTFSTVAAAVPGPSWLRASEAWAKSGEETATDLMVRFARLVFPHDRLPDSTYREVIGIVLAALASNPETEALVAGAEQALDARRGSSWTDLAEDEQLVVLGEVQGEAFFAAITGTVRGAFYYHPLVWQYLGYPGPSRGFGGYIRRGFDDIDWLPGEA